MSPQTSMSPLSHKSTPRPLLQDWKWVKLGEVSDFVRGVTFDAGVTIQWPEIDYLPIVRAGNINKILNTNEDIIWIPEKFVNREQLLRVEDIIICMSSGSSDVVGKTVTLENEWQGSVGAFCGIIRAKNNALPSFVSQWFRSHLFFEWRDSQARGANIQNLRFSQLSKLEIPLPPLSEQKRIAAILKDQMAAVDKARKAAEKRLEAVKALPGAFLRQVFPKTGQPLPEGWKWVKLGKITNVVNGTTPPSENKLYWNGNIVWITPTDLGKLGSPEITDSERRITSEGFEICNLTLVTPGTVVMSSRAPIGHLGIATIKLCTNQGCKSFVPSSDIDTYYLYYILKNSIPKLKELGSGATFNEVSKSQCENFDIAIPSLSVQKHISGLLQNQMAAADKARKAAEEELATINSIPAAILRKAFNGEI